ncbi:hypothetical protein VSH64_09080 [Amycolatopsis rhabdoformis]|uniref:YbaB/EbfC family nucleoid-associated protein n=1 Tax=Amycolatopsis rhabdoformis TaxID=1448059 RepID=A0ABZ1IEU1_9PSEU|nr:hypothetical protein [Amycolatopsis rhabdoformis]WSE32261.1 hypothetical protein VSH64_09080 [Amycolatopsis rhabdoformis]
MPAEPDLQMTDRILGQRIGSVHISHCSHDGAISVVVALDGAVVDLRITEAAAHRPPGELARDILACIHAAQAPFLGITPSNG